MQTVDPIELEMVLACAPQVDETSLINGYARVFLSVWNDHASTCDENTAEHGALVLTSALVRLNHQNVEMTGRLAREIADDQEEFDAIFGPMAAKLSSSTMHGMLLFSIALQRTVLGDAAPSLISDVDQDP